MVGKRGNRPQDATGRVKVSLNLSFMFLSIYKGRDGGSVYSRAHSFLHVLDPSDANLMINAEAFLSAENPRDPANR
jgi:hypothetical protein